MQNSKIYECEGDLPDAFPERLNYVSIDTEATGLNLFRRDRVCVIQVYCPDTNITYLIKAKQNCKPLNLIRLLLDKNCIKICHYARFDITALYLYTNTLANNIYCTKIASVIARTYSNRHGLKTICQELLGQSICKAEQSSYWGGPLTDSQKSYAANDVIFLHQIMHKLDHIIKNEKRQRALKSALLALPHRIMLDIDGFENIDIFHHNPCATY